MSRLTQLRDKILGKKSTITPEQTFLRLAGEVGPETLKYVETLIVALDGVDGTVDGKFSLPGEVKREIVVTVFDALLRKMGVSGIQIVLLRKVVEFVVARIRMERHSE